MAVSFIGSFGWVIPPNAPLCCLPVLTPLGALPAQWSLSPQVTGGLLPLHPSSLPPHPIGLLLVSWPEHTLTKILRFKIRSM